MVFQTDCDEIELKISDVIVIPTR